MLSKLIINIMAALYLLSHALPLSTLEFCSCPCRFITVLLEQREDENTRGVLVCVLECVLEKEIEIHPTLCKEKVRTQKVASSMVSNRVTWVIP